MSTEFYFHFHIHFRTSPSWTASTQHLSKTCVAESLLWMMLSFVLCNLLLKIYPALRVLGNQTLNLKLMNMSAYATEAADKPSLGVESFRAGSNC